MWFLCGFVVWFCLEAIKTLQHIFKCLLSVSLVLENNFFYIKQDIIMALIYFTGTQRENSSFDISRLRS